ncbi:MAG TPA: hypothetical protein PLP13_05285 [bacterium]|nr:hypothetical protein [bacterium]
MLVFPQGFESFYSSEKYYRNNDKRDAYQKIGCKWLTLECYWPQHDDGNY